MKTKGNEMTLQRLIADATPGGKGLLAHELLSKSGCRHGPVDGRCEVCGKAAERFTLQDWLRWHCESCAIAASRAEWDRLLNLGAAIS